MEKDYTYSAFISYSSKDEKVAKELWRKLERYRLPAVLQKQYEDIPSKMHVFLDQGDIVPGDTVENALCRELADSKKLIVICSPNSAKSKYVELEVKNFLSLGHSTNDIIPYIIDGEVDKNSPNNCYVPSLLGENDKDTLNGVSVVRDGKWKAFVGVLANLLDVKFDEIYKREKVRKNRIIVVWSGIEVIAACFILVVIWYFTPHTKYYADYVTRWGIPEGIRELNKTERKLYPEHYKITFRALRPIKLEHVNVNDTPVAETSFEEHQNRPCVIKYSYSNKFSVTMNKDNWILEKAVYEINSNIPNVFCPKYKMQLIYTKITDNEYFIDFYYDSEDKLPKSLSNDLFSSQNLYFSDITFLSTTGYSENQSPDYIIFNQTSSIFRFKIEFDKTSGFDKKIIFYNKNSHTVHDSNGIYGVILEHDEKGRIIEEQYLYDNTNFYDFKKINIKKMKYDLDDRLENISFFYTYNDLTKTNFEKTFFEAISADKNINEDVMKDFNFSQNSDNTVSNLLFDSDSKKESKIREVLINNKSRNYAQKQIKWSTEGNSVVQTISFFDEEGQIAYDYINNCSIIENYFDLDGRLYKTIYYSKNDTIIQEVIEYFENGLPKEIKKTDCHGSVFIKNEYINELTMPAYEISNENGEVIEKLELSIEKENMQTMLIKEIKNDSGLMKNTQVYDEYGRYIENLIYKENDILSVKILYHGLNRSICYFLNNEYNSSFVQYARADFSFSNDGMIQLACFKDEKGLPADSITIGFSTYWAIYSPNSLLLAEEYGDKNAFLVIPKGKKYSRFDGKTDINDLILVEGKYIDSTGELVNEGVAFFNSEFNSENETIINYYDNDNFILRKLYYYDGSINKITDCQQNEDCYSEMTYSYDGIPIKECVKYNSGEGVTEYSDGKKSFSSYIYNDGRKTEKYYDSNENCICLIKYNAKGEKEFIEVSKYNSNIRNYVLDSYQNGEKEEFFCDDNGNVIHKLSYSSDGNQIAEVFGEYAGNVCIHLYGSSANGDTYDSFYNENGVLLRKIEYDAAIDEKKEYEYKDAVLNLITVYKGNFKESLNYFENGDITYAVKFNKKGEKSELFRKNGEIVHRVDYDNEKKSFEFFYEDGILIRRIDYNSDGTKRELLYDNNNLLYFIDYTSDGLKESEIEYRNNQTYLIKNYSENKLIEETYFNDDEKPYSFIKYSTDGSILEKMIAEYKDDEIVYTENIYPDGKKIQAFLENEKPIHVISYSSDGNIEEEEIQEFKNDELIHWVYYDNERNAIEEFYENGECVHKVISNALGFVEEEWFNEYHKEEVEDKK